MSHRHMIRTLPAALAIAGAMIGTLSAAPARADWGWNQNDWAQGQAVSVQLQVEGSTAPLYLSPNADARRYFEAFAGRNYSVVLRNNTATRLGVLISVDGLNVVSGVKSQLSPNEQMYVLGPWETTTIRGWRTSLNDIQRFVFVDEQRSYAERTGQANGDMGWIRVLAFHEQRAWWTPPPRQLYKERNTFELQGSRDGASRSDEPQAAAPAPSASGKPQFQEAPQQAQGEAKAQRQLAEDGMIRLNGGQSYPGTGWGEHRNDPVQRIEFTAERRPTDTLNFRYEYASGLQALGIYRHRDRLHERDNGELGFAKPPRW